MARSLSSAAPLIAALSESVALLANRRGFSAAAAAAAAAGSPAVRRVGAMEEKAVMKKRKTDGAVENSWVPDPVTGYYRPGNRTGEVDAAELREVLLSRRSQL